MAVGIIDIQGFAHEVIARTQVELCASDTSQGVTKRGAGWESESGMEQPGGVWVGSGCDPF